MNFKDAAIKVLSENKKPLHYKKITTIALNEKLIDFLGASPEKRMLDSLKLEVKKKDTLVSAVRPGFFILKEFFNKNIKNNKENKAKRRIETLKKEHSSKIIDSQPENSLSQDKVNFDEIKRISEFSKQIFSKQYFSNDILGDKIFKVKTKNEIPKRLLDYILKQKKSIYYSSQDLLSIIEKERIFDISKISGNEIILLINKFNKIQKTNSFFINENKITAYALLESNDLYKNYNLIVEELKNRDKLINREIINWFNRISFTQFYNLSKMILKNIGLYNIKSIKGFSGYYFLTEKLGLSELNLILLIKKGKEEVTRADIIEARGVSSRFGYSNIVILTSSQFNQSAIEETKMNGANIVLMDNNFIFDSMRKYSIGIYKENSIYKIDYDFFLSL